MLPIPSARFWMLLLAVALGFQLGVPASRAAYVELRSPRNSGAPLTPDGILKAQAGLAYKLIAHLSSSAEPRSNIVVSPAGVAAVLSLLDIGASARMRSAIHHTLSFPRRSRSIEWVDLAGIRKASATLAGNGQRPGPLSFANSIVFAPATQPKQDALIRLAAAGADVAVEDLSSTKTITQINDWVRDRTRGQIPVVLEKAPQNVGLIAINALYFAGRWRTPFDASETAPAPFHSSVRKVVQVPMMHLDSGEIRFRANRQFIAVDLPYKTPGYSMVIVTTRDRPSELRAFGSVKEWLSGDKFDLHDGEVLMPRFSLTDRRDLLRVLDAMGLRRGRLSPEALSGFSAKATAISRVVQRTKIKIDEKGTVAAATTMVEIERSMPRDFIKMVVDKPFMFALRSKDTGLILLAGYVRMPVESGMGK